MTLPPAHMLLTMTAARCWIVQKAH